MKRNRITPHNHAIAEWTHEGNEYGKEATMATNEYENSSVSVDVKKKKCVQRVLGSLLY